MQTALNPVPRRCSGSAWQCLSPSPALGRGRQDFIFWSQLDFLLFSLTGHSFCPRILNPPVTAAVPCPSRKAGPTPAPHAGPEPTSQPPALWRHLGRDGQLQQPASSRTAHWGRGAAFRVLSTKHLNFCSNCKASASLTWKLHTKREGAPRGVGLPSTHITCPSERRFPHAFPYGGSLMHGV